MSSKREYRKRNREDKGEYQSQETVQVDEKHEGVEESVVGLPHAKNGFHFHNAWVGLILRHGTTKLPKKPWMKTACRELNTIQKCVGVHRTGYAIKLVMMHANNIPRKPNMWDAVDSVCRTPNCIVPDHHRWLHISEKLSRESCGRSFMCPTCRIEIHLPCSHNPPCRWRVLSNGDCTNCQQDGNQDEAKPVADAANESPANVLIGPKRKGSSSLISTAAFESQLRCENQQKEDEDYIPVDTLPHAEIYFHNLWVGVIQRTGTTKLPKRQWMKTHCMKLNKSHSTAGGGWCLASVMMRGTNMPHKQRKMDAVDSICRTSGCIVPDHHRWLLKSEKLSRECCGRSLMCSTCHVKIPFPCPHSPHCEWTVVAKENCSACKIHE